jgi:predicted nucleotidyltransferase/uncharacterized protein (UPF0332 family)
MQFKIQKKDDDNLQRYPTDDLRVANEFVKQLNAELEDFIVAAVLFGSSARRDTSPESDIDVLIIGNDIDFVMTQPLIETYRIIIEKLIAKNSTRLHVTSMTFTAFWDYSRAGDPVVVNILRDGISLHDSGFFRPLQHLLRQGRIRPSEESLWRYFSRAPKTMMNSRSHLMQATLDLYWAVIDAAHAALMKRNQVPPSPDHVADLLEKIYVKKKELEPKYIETMRKFYKLMKSITHREIQEIKGNEYEAYYKEASQFIGRMKRLIYRH